MNQSGTDKQQTGCPFCEKKGLPILPLRYAVARNDFNRTKDPQVPKLAPPFGDGVNDIALPAGLQYTMRLLRAGYLYVFNATRGSWDGYVVTEKSYLYPFVTGLKHDLLKAMDPNKPQSIDSLLQPPSDKIEFSCRREPDHPHLARCVMIPNAEAADQVKMVFSDTAWTKRLWHEHATNAKVNKDGPARQKQMRELSLAKWRGGSVKHADDLSKLAERVAEALYHWQAPEEAKPKEPGMLEEVVVFPHEALRYSPHSTYGMKQQVPDLIAWAQAQAARVGMRPMLVALDDPVGITMELASLMSYRLEMFMQRPDLQRPLAISSLLGSLEEAIRNQAELNKIKAVQDEAALKLEYWRNIPYYSGGEGIRDPNRTRMETEHWHRLENDPVYRREWEQKVANAKQAAADQLSSDDLDVASEKAWKKYRKKLRENEPQNWAKKTYQKELKEFDQAKMAPLARAHKAWVKSARLLLCLDCNHDDQDAESGEGFVDTLLLCLQDTQTNQLSFDYYREWLEAATIERDNLLLRALAYNQKAVIDALNKEIPKAGVPVDKLPSVPWKSLIGLYDKSTKHLKEGGENAVARLMVALGGPVIKVLDTALDKGAGPLVIKMGLIGRTPVVHIRYTGFVSDALDTFVKEMKAVTPALANVDQDLLKRRLEIKTRGEYRRMSPAAGGKWNVEIMASRLELEKIPEEGLTENQAAKRAGKAVMRFKDWEVSAPQRWKTLVSTKLRVGVISGILQIVSMNKLAEKLDNSMSHERRENAWRYRAAVGATIGAFGGLVDEAMNNTQKLIGGRLTKFVDTFWGKLLGRMARAAGVIAAGIMAVCDAWRAYREFQEGNLTISALYIVSAVSGFGAALLFSGWLGATVLGLSATGIGVVLVLISIAIVLLIEFFKDDKLQDWLERSEFGTFEKGDRYQELDEELKQFELAVKAN